MYTLQLTHYAVPHQQSVGVEEAGNFFPVASAVRTIFYELDQRAPEYEVAIEGLNAENLRKVPFGVRGQTIETIAGNPQRTDFTCEQIVNFGKDISVPKLMHAMEYGLDDAVTKQLADLGNPILSDPCLYIGGDKPSGEWAIRMYSESTMYEVKIVNNPGFFGRSVMLNIEIEESLAKEKDIQGVIEVARVLADADFRNGKGYERYKAGKRGKDVALYQVFQLPQPKSTSTPLVDKLFDVLDNDRHINSMPTEKVTPGNFMAVMPKYLVLADRMRHEVRDIQSDLNKRLKMHQLYVEMMGQENPQLQDALDIKAEWEPGVEKKVEDQLAMMNDLKYHEVDDTNDRTKVSIGQQLMVGAGLMEKRMGILRSHHAIIKRMEQSGFITADTFDQKAFFERIARHDTTSVAREAVELLNSARDAQ